MYSYQHRYHAGSFADIHKHIVLLAVLKYLHNKPTSFGVLDLFAGEGLYNLDLKEAQKTQEFLSGYGVIKQDLENGENRGGSLFTELSNIINKYKDLYNQNIYAGSPGIIASQLRMQDKAIFIENHPQAYQELLNYFEHDKNIKLYKRDAYTAANALIPLKEKRGVVLIDPSYEVKSEYQSIVELISKIYNKASHYIYIIWYPLLVKNNYYQDLFELFNKIQHDGEKVWCSELVLKNKIATSAASDNNHIGHIGMYGSGMIVINSPWQMDVLVKQNFDNSSFAKNMQFNSSFLESK